MGKGISKSVGDGGRERERGRSKVGDCVRGLMGKSKWCVSGWDGRGGCRRWVHNVFSLELVPSHTIGY